MRAAVRGPHRRSPHTAYATRDRHPTIWDSLKVLTSEDTFIYGARNSNRGCRCSKSRLIRKGLGVEREDRSKAGAVPPL